MERITKRIFKKVADKIRRERRPTRGLALLLTLTMIIVQLPATAMEVKADTTSTLNVGAFNYGTGKFDQATGSGTDTYATLTIGLNYTAGSIGVSLPSVTGFTLSTNTNYTKKINLTNKTASEIAAYIRQIQFSGYTSYGFEVSFTVEKAAASFTPDHYAGNDHYYLYVSFSSLGVTAMNWQDAYTKAKSYEYCGQTGYLATLTSKAEEETVQTITGGCTGWLGGTRMVHNATSGSLYYTGFSTSSNNAYWYWACGPERGEVFYNATNAQTSSQDTQAGNGYYFNWNSGEPNGTINDENCLTILNLTKGSGYQTGDSKCWNDIVYNRSSSDVYCPTGFVVEFGSGKTSFGSTTRLYDSYKVQAHSHDWNYTLASDGKSISTTCQNTLGACTSGYNNNTYTLSINASDAEYTGSAYNVAGKLTVTNNITSGSGSGKVTGCTVSSVYYEGITDQGTSYTATTTPPTRAGYYKAYINVTGTKIASVTASGTYTTSTVNYTIQDTFTITDSEKPSGSIKVEYGTGASSTTTSNTWTDSLLTNLTTPSKINFYSQVPEVTLSYSDAQSNVKKVEYFYTTEADASLTYTQAQLEAKDSGWTTYYSLLTPAQADAPFDLASTKSVVYVKITDIFDNVRYISSDVILVDQAAVDAYNSAGATTTETPLAAWYSTDESGNVTVNYGSLEEAIQAANDASLTTSIVVRPGATSTTATSSLKADADVSVYVPEGTSVSVDGDTISNPTVGEQDSYVTVTSLNGNNAVSTEVGQKVSINGTSYSNASLGTEEEDSPMVLTVNSSDQVVLTDGKINLDQGENVYVERDGNKVLVANTTTGDNKAVVVTPALGSGTENKIKAAEGASLTLTETTSGGATKTNSYTATEGTATISLTDSQENPVLTSGSVDLAGGSSITLTKTTEEGSQYATVKADTSSTPEVSSDGSVSLDNNEKVFLGDTSDRVLVTNATTGEEEKEVVVTPAFGSGSDTTIEAAKDAAVTIAETTVSGTTINTYTAAEENTKIALENENSNPVLTNGSVDVTDGSTIAVAKTSGENTSYVTITGESSSAPQVSANGDIEFDQGQTVKIDGSDYSYTAAVDNTTINVNQQVEDTDASAKDTTPVLTAGALVLGGDSVYVQNSQDSTTTYTKVNNADTSVADQPKVYADGSVSLSSKDSVSLTTYTEEGSVSNTVTADDSNTASITVNTTASGAVNTSVGNGQSVAINEEEYTSKSDNTVIASTGDSSTPELTAGQVEVAKDSTIQVKAAQVTTTGSNNATVSADGSIDLANNSKVTVKDTNSDKENVIQVGSSATTNEAITIKADDAGNLNVPLQNQETITINDNTYIGATEAQEGQTAQAEIKVDLSQESQTLTGGSVDLTKGSEINVEVTTGEEGQETTTTSTISASDTTKPTVYASGSVDMHDNCTIETTTNGKTTTISTASGQGEEAEEETTTVQLKGTSVEVNLSQDKEITVGDNNYKAKSDDTTLNIADKGATLTSGSVELAKDDSVNVNGTSVTNVGSDASKLVVSVNGVEEGENPTASIQVEEGESYMVGQEGSENGYVFTNAAAGGGEEEEGGTAIYQIDSAGNLLLSGEDLPVTVGDSTMHIGGQSEDGTSTQVTAKVTEEGVEVTADPGENIKVRDAQGKETLYKNGGEENENLVVTLKEDGGVYLEEGTALPQAGGVLSVDQPVSGTETEKVYEIKNCGEDDSIAVERTTENGKLVNRISFTQEGAAIELTDAGTTSSYKATTENASILLTEGVPKLEAGGLSLGSGSKLQIQDTGLQVTNTGDQEDGLSLERKTITLTDGGEEVEVTELSLAAGGKAKISKPGSQEKVGIEIQNKGNSTSTYELMDDGTVTIGDQDQLTVTGGSQGDVSISPSTDSSVAVKVDNDQVAVTIAEEGDALTVGVGDSTSTLTAVSAPVELAVKEGEILLEDGKVGLSENAGLTLGSSGKKYTNQSQGQVEISIDKNAVTNHAATIGTMTLGTDAKVALGNTGNIAIKNIDTTEAASLQIKGDGSLILAANQEIGMEIKGSSFTICCDGDLDMDLPAGENSAKFTIPAGKTLTITDAAGVAHTYTNNGSEPLVISLDKDGDIALLSGAVSLANGESVYMADSKGNQILVEATENSSIMIGSDGEIVIPTGSTAIIGDNLYTGATEAAEGETGKARVKFNPEGGAPILTEGQVDLASGSTIAKEVSVNGKAEVTEIKNTSQGETDNSISVGDTITLQEGQRAELSLGQKTYNLEVPENGGKASISLEASGTAPNQELKMGLTVSPVEGQTSARLVINGGTYTADCSGEDGSLDASKKLALDLDGEDGEVRIADAGVSQITLENGSLVVGDSTVTAASPAVTIQESTDSITGKKTGEYTVPAGGQLTLVKEGTEEEAVTLKVPEDAQTPVNVEKLSGGQLGLKLDENQTVEINGGSITAESENTEISVSNKIPELISGSASISGEAELQVGQSLIANEGDDDHPVKAFLDTTTDPATPKISVAAGGSYRVSQADPTGDSTEEGAAGITYTNDGNQEATFSLTTDGAMEIPAGVSLPVTIGETGSTTISGTGGLATKITGEGVEITSDNEETITVGDENYKNLSDGKLLLDAQGQVELTEGQVGLGEDSSLVLNLKDGENTIQNSITNTSSDPEAGVEVKADGSLTLAEGASILAIIDGKEESYQAETEDTKLVMGATSMTLESGKVSLGNSSVIAVADGTGTNTYGNVGTSGEVSLEKDPAGNVSIGVGPGATLEVAPSAQVTKFKADLTNNTGTTKNYSINEAGYLETNPGDNILLKQEGKTEDIRITPSGETGLQMKVTEESLDLKLMDGQELTIAGFDGDETASGLKAQEGGADLSITDVGIELKDGGVEMTSGSKLLVGHSDDQAGMIYQSISDQTQGQSGLVVTYDADSKTGSMTIPASQGLAVSLPGSSQESFRLLNQEESSIHLNIQEDGWLLLPAGSQEEDSTITLAVGEETFSIQAPADGSGVKLMASEEGARLSIEPGESLFINGKEYKNVGSTELVFTINSQGQIILESGELQVEAEEPIWVKDQEGNTNKIQSQSGALTLKRSQAEDGSLSISATTTSQPGEEALLQINDASLGLSPEGEEEGADLSVSLDGKTGQLSLAADCTGDYHLTNGSLTIGNTVVSTQGDQAVEISRPSSLEEPTVNVAAGGNVTLGNKTTGKAVEMKLPEDGNSKEVTLNTKTGSISVDLEEGETITIGGITYTLGEESGKLVVDSQTGQLNTKKTEVNPTASIDPDNFDKENYVYNLSQKEALVVGDTQYKLASGKAALVGNPDGNPIVKAEAGTKLVVGDQTIQAVNDESEFIIEENGEITLRDNGQESNSAVRLTGSQKREVDGISYQAEETGAAYTITYSDKGDTIQVEDDSTVQASLSDGKVIYLSNGLYLKASGEGVQVSITKDGATGLGKNKLIPIKDAQGNLVGYQVKVVEDKKDDGGDEEDDSGKGNGGSGDNGKGNGGSSNSGKDNGDSGDSGKGNSRNDDSGKGNSGSGDSSKGDGDQGQDKQEAESNQSSTNNSQPAVTSQESSAISTDTQTDKTDEKTDNQKTNDKKTSLNEEEEIALAEDSGDETETLSQGQEDSVQVTLEDLSQADSILITAAETTVSYGKGSIVLSSMNEEGSLAGDLGQTLRACFTEEELAAIYDGVSARVKLEVELIALDQEEVSEDEQEIQQAIEGWQEEVEGLTYLDSYKVVLSRNYNEEGWQVLTQLSKAITIEFQLEEDCIAIGKQCYGVRDHEGTCDLLEDLDQEEDKVTIETDRFSTYALAYIAELDQVVVPATEETDGGFPWWILILLVLVAGASGTYVYTKKRNKR